MFINGKKNRKMRKMKGQLIFDINHNPIGICVQEHEEGFILVLTQLTIFSEYTDEQLKEMNFSRKEKKWVKRIRRKNK